MEARRVLIYRNEILPATETFILSQASALRRFQPVFAGLKLVNHGLEMAPHPILTLSGSQSWKARMQRRIFLRTGYSRRFTCAIAAQNPQIIHTHFAVDAGSVLSIAQRLCVPLVVTLHGYDVTCSEDELQRWPATRAYLRRREEIWRYTSLFFCVSKHIRQCAVAAGFPEDKLREHYVGIRLCDGVRYGRLREKKTVLFVGRLVEKKGCVHLIHAMSRVQKRIPEAQLVVIGDGPLRKVLERQAELYCKNTVFLGYQSQAAVKEWMHRAHLLAAPSIRARSGDAEGLPTVLCEAQAEGLPVTGFATDGVTEAFPEERRSSLPKTGDIDGLAEVIIRLMTDDEAWQQAADVGKKYVESHFNLIEQTRLLEAMYEEVIARHRE